METLFVDFKNGLHGVKKRHIVAEYEYAKERNLDFIFEALQLATLVVTKKIKDGDDFYNAYSSLAIDEIQLFRTVAKLQNQVKREKLYLKDKLTELFNENNDENDEYETEDESETETEEENKQLYDYLSEKEDENE